ncbi:sporulation stage III, protein AA [Clostridium paraputrificum]|uniref:stage III sporulation protein AA n=1 Tax=Clostridium paraputrificum TaxID=29363 RepID=UPI000D8AB0B3|nr:stage III sporulation protein AA [Clostridium paraputrificum]SQB99727.1 sporulation stage III, protein AA [Clostridium paraputrificum]
MDILDEGIVKLFPPRVVEALGEYLKDNALQEIRLKIEKPIIITSSKGEVVLSYILGREDIKYILQRISNYSLYAYEEEIRQGFITIRGGHRVGLAGECVMDNGKVKTIRNISSLNIRICREILGCSKKVMKYIVEDKKVLNTLIISPPKCGKTTILRDIARNLSDRGKKISIIDERSEIAASYLGVPQMKVGIRTDVLDNCLKSEGLIMAIRSLSPEIIICDEIGTLKDIEALIMAFNSGVNIIVTLHGESIDDLTNRSVFKELLENNVVERVILLSNREGVGTVENVYSLSKGGEKKWSRLY